MSPSNGTEVPHSRVFFMQLRFCVWCGLVKSSKIHYLPLPLFPVPFCFAIVVVIVSGQAGGVLLSPAC